MARVFDEVDPAYATACSDVTLYSNPRGFFRSLAEELVAVPGDAWLQDVFGTASGEPGKVAAVLDNEELKEAISEVMCRVQPLHRGKDPKVSQERRLAAQAALDRSEVAKGLALACQAVLKAPMTGDSELVDAGVSLALSLWVRAEGLQRAGRPAAALQDLKLALKERLPAKMRAQYYWRMGDCYKDAREPSRAKVSYELAGRLLAKDEDAKAKLQAAIASLDTLQEQKPKTNKNKGASLSSGPKQNMPALSKLVKITEEENKGRFAVAAAGVRAGDTLLIESPYATCLLPDCYGTHCLHCFTNFGDLEDSAPVWCTKCSGVAFCSTNCKDTAISTYHQYECPFLDLFIGSGMSILSYVALRMVTQAGLEASLSMHSKYVSNDVKTVEGTALNDIEGSTKKSKMKSRKERLNRTKKGMKSLDKLIKEENEENVKLEENVNFEESLELKSAQIYSLCTHSELRRPNDYLKRIIMAMFLTECLKKGGFFKTAKDNEEKCASNITELLTRNLQLLQFNAHEIYETARGKHMFSGAKTVYIAVGIYPTGALFNHECYPAVARYFEGRKIVLRATRPLAPGDVVSENYGPHFMVRPLTERQRSLASRYWFRCGCTACRDDWPMLKEMSSDAPVTLKCINEKCNNKIRLNPKPPKSCGKCSSPLDQELLRAMSEHVTKCTTQYQEGAKLMEAEDPEAAIATMCAAVDTYHEIARPPHRGTHLAQEALRSCFAVYGNCHVIQSADVD